MQVREIVVDSMRAGTRLDRFLADTYPDLSRSLIQRLIETGEVLVDGQTSKPGARVVTGQLIKVNVPAPEPTCLEPEAIPLDIVYEDDELLVLNKPPGLVVHPAAGHTRGTLVHALLARYPNIAIGNAYRPGIVHRLDKDTSGLMVVAKTDSAYAHLAQQMLCRQVLKEYLALVHGHVDAVQGTIDAPIGRDPKDRRRMAVVEWGRPARTHFVLRERLKEYDLLLVRLETGRTHQIRVHFASIGHPVAGDQVYGCAAGETGPARQFLHACRLGFRLPSTEGYVEFSVPLPADLADFLAKLREDTA